MPLPPHTAPKTQIVFRNKTWKVMIDPATLFVAALPHGSSKAFVISAAQSQPSGVAGLQSDHQKAHWTLRDKQIAIRVRLEDDGLQVDFVAQKPGEFTFPILPAQATNRAYILPLGEGAYVPVRDGTWSDYLIEQEGISTTEGFSLPIWGIDTGTHTLTYLLTNPFNNEFAFQKSSGSLAAKLTHRFTWNHPVKTYGLRISLGPSSPTEPAKQYRRFLQRSRQFVSLQEKIRRIPEAAKLLGAAHVYLWGDGVSPQMLETLRSSGFDRLWLGGPSWKPLQENPATIERAKSLGYLIGPYDSYASVHSPAAKPEDTWETAQFDQKLYDTGAIVLATGKKKTGFQKKGYYVNAKLTMPYVKARVARLMKQFQCNSWFIDCDAAGEFYDDFSPQHPITQQQEMQARLQRMTWIRDSYRLVIGSEGGAAYAASTIHFAHGMMTKPFGWGDDDLKDKSSAYFLGAYYPPDAPALFFKPVPLKPKYYPVLFDARYRLPLYQTVFHDSVIATNHWTLPTLKFSDQVVERTLLEGLYNVPPLYHLNNKEFEKRGDWLKAQYAFFSPLHKEAGLLSLTDFTWLTTDRTVQRTRFGDKIEIVANFGTKPFSRFGRELPAKSLLAINHATGETILYTPQPL